MHAQKPHLTPPIADQTASEKVNILIVDDRPENLFVLESLLESPDLNIVRATSGQEALRLMCDHDFALVLMDVQMPDMDGFETAELMRGNARTKHIPVIFVTANYTERQHIFRGYDAGAVDYLFKPLEPQMLLSKVYVFLEIHRQRLALKAEARLLDSKILELQELQSTLQKKNEHLHLLSTLDGLTGIPNRRQFNQTLETEWQQRAQKGRPLSLIILDVDHFKNYNDYYGHFAGDICLKRVAQALAERLNRPKDVLARFGGEEFAVILPDTPLGGAVHLAETMRRTVEQLSIEHKASAIHRFVTISLGVSSVLPSDTCSASDLIESADHALYKAKIGGRNRTVSTKLMTESCKMPTH